MTYYQKTKYPGILKSKKAIQIDFYLANGTRCREVKKILPTAENLKWASSYRGAILTDIAKGTFDYASYFPSSKYLKNKNRKPKDALIRDVVWKEEVQNPDSETRAVSLLKERAGMRLIEKYVGHLTVVELTRGEIKRCIKIMREKHKLSDKTIRNYLVPLRRVVTWGFDQNLITNNPFDYLKVKKTLKEKRKANFKKRDPFDIKNIDPFDIDELNKIAESSTGQLHNMLQFCFWTGLRLCELFALGWDNVDFKKRIVVIDTGVVLGEYGPTKTDVERIVELNDQAYNALQAQSKHTWFKQPIKIRLDDEEKNLRVVFYDERFDRPYTDTQQLGRDWKPLLKAAEVRYRPAKYMRHTYASLSLAAGEDEKWVANQLGHATVEMIRRTYAKWLNKAAEAAGRKGGMRINDLGNRPPE